MPSQKLPQRSLDRQVSTPEKQRREARAVRAQQRSVAIPESSMASTSSTAVVIPTEDIDATEQIMKVEELQTFFIYLFIYS